MIVMIDFEVYLFLLCVFLYYLWNFFDFVGKHIDWRLPSMKIIVSIMLHWIPSKSSLYISKIQCPKYKWHNDIYFP